jgi:hypothetical protein
MGREVLAGGVSTFQHQHTVLHSTGAKSVLLVITQSLSGLSQPRGLLHKPENQNYVMNTSPQVRLTHETLQGRGGGGSGGGACPSLADMSMDVSLHFSRDSIFYGGQLCLKQVLLPEADTAA